MGILDDTAVFAAVVQQGGFSHAAKYLGLSNGLISRRIAQLESDLGVTLIKRTTRQLHLTPEGELFWQHAQRIQQELDAALSLIQSSAQKPKGTIRVSAPLHFGRHYLTPIILKFLTTFNDIHIDLILSNQQQDPVKEGLDLVIRGAGYLEETSLKDSSLQMKLLFKEKIGLYASPGYLLKHGQPATPEALAHHITINYVDNRRLPDAAIWTYLLKNKKHSMTLKPQFNCNDIESGLIACTGGFGIGKFTELNVKHALQQQQLQPVLENYEWGHYHLYAIYPHQQALPKRTRLLLEFIHAHIKNLAEKLIG
ncbi:LysR family transcriptional regulator [Aquicella lusitana]|uniref:LysR family transcriptional regulator n=1 Tax=Aquicella lusitana TaxID=254246 RepID=A0A370G5H8_9COXI|nr:LysR family transcriptional regulator [Aquicella lusitana]RDI39062.1 LysR family transcriptional regulator [Aquicella lusitana]VVC73669.1 HTH-type transcriptional regulator DmlR [Aquicella lusitana]